MATSGAIISLRLAHNDFNSEQADHQIMCLNLRKREARTVEISILQVLQFPNSLPLNSGPCVSD
jgi:hypothetical protein